MPIKFQTFQSLKSYARYVNIF